MDEEAGGRVSTAIDFDPLNPQVLRDPYPLYSRLREAAPVLWDEPLQSWLLTRHRDCVSVSRNMEHFASDPRRAGEPVPDFALNIQILDSVEHAPVRSLLSSACRAQDMASILRRARQHADQLLSRLSNKGSGEFMSDFAAPFALAVICDFIGVEPPDLAILGPIGDAFMQGMDAGLRPERAKPAAEAQDKLGAIFDSWFKSPPSGGLFGTLLTQSPDKVLTPAIKNSLYVIFNSGFLSVSGAIGNAVLALLRSDLELTARLNPGTLDLAVEELLRYDGYVQAMSRICVKDIEFGDARISRGQNVILLLGAANRDPDEFVMPDSLVLDRTPNRHLQLGWGIHSCLGAFLARNMMKITLSSLLDHPDPIRLAGEPSHKPQATVRCPDRIPVSLKT